MKLKQLIVLFLAMLGCLIRTVQSQMSFLNNTDAIITFATLANQDNQEIYKKLGNLHPLQTNVIDLSSNIQTYYLTFKHPGQNPSNIIILNKKTLGQLFNSTEPIQIEETINELDDDANDYYTFTIPILNKAKSRLESNGSGCSEGKDSEELCADEETKTIKTQSIDFPQTTENLSVFTNSNRGHILIIQQIDDSTGALLEEFPIQPLESVYFNNKKEKIHIISCKKEDHVYSHHHHYYRATQYSWVISKEKNQSSSSFKLFIAPGGEPSSCEIVVNDMSGDNNTPTFFDSLATTCTIS